MKTGKRNNKKNVIKSLHTYIILYLQRYKKVTNFFTTYTFNITYLINNYRYLNITNYKNYFL